MLGERVYLCLGTGSCWLRACIWAACSIVAKIHDWDRDGWWLKPWCSCSKICTAVGPRPLLNLINWKSLWIKSDFLIYFYF